MKNERYIEIEGEKIFQSDIEKMSLYEIHNLMMFISTERELRFVQSYCLEAGKVHIQNLTDKL